MKISLVECDCGILEESAGIALSKAYVKKKFGAFCPDCGEKIHLHLCEVECEKDPNPVNLSEVGF